MNGSEGNYLAETYRNKSFTLLDIMAYFYVLQILGDEVERTLPEILDEIPVVSEEIEFTKDNLRIKLDELLACGLIEAKKDGRNVKYFISNDVWENLSEDEIKEVYLYLEFLRNTSPMDVPYYFLQRKLKLYALSERQMDLSEVSVFKFRQNHMFNSLDNDILLVCLQALHCKQYVSVTKESGSVHRNLLPIKVIHDSTYGRQYLLYFDHEYQSVCTVRIDRIKAIEIGKELSKDDRKIVEDNLDAGENSWCTSSRQDGAQEITICFLFDEEKEDFILRRIEREGHGGTLTKESEGKYIYKKVIEDPNEMIPWIRSFGERAKVISSGTALTEKTIAEDWERAAKKYESLS
jgi:predicted DNA-binding transcriptional regulator YafY